MITLDVLLGEKRPGIIQLAERHGAHNMRVFGSVARGDSGENSDVDFLAEFDEGRTLFDLIALRLDLCDLLGTNVDIATPASLRYIRDRVLAEARAI